MDDGARLDRTAQHGGIRRAAVVVAAGLLAQPALASETVTYGYDPLGRLVTSTHAGSVNNGLQQTYAHDAADNRTNVTVTGSPFNNGTRVVAVPLLGGALIVTAVYP